MQQPLIRFSLATTADPLTGLARIQDRDGSMKLFRPEAYVVPFKYRRFLELAGKPFWRMFGKEVGAVAFEKGSWVYRNRTVSIRAFLRSYPQWRDLEQVFRDSPEFEWSYEDHLDFYTALEWMEFKGGFLLQFVAPATTL